MRPRTAARLAAALAVVLPATVVAAQPGADTGASADPGALPGAAGGAVSDTGAGAVSDTGVADPSGSGGAAAQVVDPEAPPAAGARRRVALAPSMTEPEPLPGAPPAPTGAAAYVAGDAAAGRAYLSPTAFTSPRGRASVNAWFPGVPVGGLLTVGYAFTDRVEVSAGGFGVVDEDDGVFYVGGKVQILRGDTAGLAAQVQHLADGEGDGVTLWTLVGSRCFDPACRTVGSLHLTALPIASHVYYDGGSQTEHALAILAGGSIVTSAGSGFKLVLDGLKYGDRSDQLLLLYGGLRYASATFSGDLGFVVGIEDDDVEALPVPLASLSARW